MKQINEYLSTKVHINNGFPEKPIKSEIVNFLKQNGFKQLHTDGTKYPVDELLEQTTAKYILHCSRSVGKHKEYWIRFIDPNVSNLVIFCRASTDGELLWNDFYIEHDSHTNNEKFEDFIKFKKEIDKIFNW